MKLPAVSIIGAMTLKGVIGNKGAMPWRIKRDMERFKTLTANSAVVMGPKTYESIGRPLPGRLNIIITTNRTYEAPPGVLVAHDPRQALELAAIRGYAEFFAIGGATVYTSFLSLPQTEHLFITYIRSNMRGDTHFPHWNKSEWRKVWREEKWVKGEGDDFPTQFAEFRRVPKAEAPDTQRSWHYPHDRELPGKVEQKKKVIKKTLKKSKPKRKARKK
jgi:dihydrofolate reductase